MCDFHLLFRILAFPIIYEGRPESKDLLAIKKNKKN
jgi:hypothetical protein